MTAAAGLPGQQGTPEETARFVIGTAVLAPSVHNTQPWRFAVRPGEISLYADPDRWLAVADPAGRELFREELRRTVEHLRDVPSVVAWVLFNEGWGQFDSRRLTGELRALDPMRPIDSASGWHDRGAGDLLSRHVYRRRFRMPRRRDARAVVLSEYGGEQLRERAQGARRRLTLPGGRETLGFALVLLRH